MNIKEQQPLWFDANYMAEYSTRLQEEIDFDNRALAGYFYKIALLDIRAAGRKGYRKTCVYVRPNVKDLVVNALKIDGFVVTDVMNGEYVVRNRLWVEW